MVFVFLISAKIKEKNTLEGFRVTSEVTIL
jgi:hypothetical protein